MGLLNLVDLGVVVFYLAGITLIGSRFYRKNANMQDYIVGSRSMKWFPVAILILAADTSAISYMGVPAWSFQKDLKLNQSIFTFLVAIPIVIWLFLPIYSRGGLYTAYQYLENRFDLRVRLLGSVFFQVIRGAHVAIIIYAPALMMSELMGVPLKFSILGMGLLTAFYTARGGIKAVIWTDAIQVGTVFLGFTVLAYSVLTHIPGGLHDVMTVGSANGKFALFDFSFNMNKVDNFWAMMIGSTVLFVEAMSTDQAILQKYFTTKSKTETSKSLVFYGFFIIVFSTLLSILGVLLFVFYVHHPALRTSLHNPDAVVPHYAASMLPHGLAGLLVASIFAGSMSTVSASLNSLATSSVVDIYKRLMRGERSERHYIFATRLATGLWGLFATVSAFQAGRLGPLNIAFSKIESLIGGVMLGIFLLGVLSKRATGTGVLLGAAIGFASVVYVAWYTSAGFYWYCVLGCLSTVIAGWLCSILISPGMYPRHPGIEESKKVPSGTMDERAPGN